MTIDRVALTSRQVETLELPSFQAEEKRRDPRFAWYLQRYGSRCWELDALSPVILRRDVEAAIVRRLNLSAWARADQVERAEQESLVSILDTWPGISSQV